MSPSRAPTGDAVARSRDVVDCVCSAPGHKYNRERNELLQLLSLPHLQVSEFPNPFRSRIATQSSGTIESSLK